MAEYDVGKFVCEAIVLPLGRVLVIDDDKGFVRDTDSTPISSR